MIGMFSNRMKNLESSGIRKIFELASTMKDPIDLSLGRVDFDVPDEAKAAAVRAIQEGKNSYSVTAGIPELKAAISNALSSEGVKTDAQLVTSGASGGLLLSLLTLADESTEVLIPDPYFVTYGHLVRLTGATPRWIDTYPDFRLTPQRLKESLKESLEKSGPAPKSRILLFNSPVNPTGVAYTAREIKELAQTARQFELQVISDEVYDLFSYDYPHETWLKYDPQALLIRAFSKKWGMAGWRLGFAAGPKDIIDQMTMLQQFTFVCGHVPSQWAAIEALKIDMQEQLSQYRKKRDFVYEGLKQAFKLKKPEGAFYAFPEAPRGDAEVFLQKCLKEEILIVPGKSFSRKNTHFRISFAVSDETLKRGIDGLVRIAKMF